MATDVHAWGVRVCTHCRSVYLGPLTHCRMDGTPLVEGEDPLIGTELDRYLVEENIGEGAMGRVYRARHRVIELDYAIKVLYGDYGADPKFRERFRREARSAGKIRHPNIVSVEDFGTTEEGLCFLVMELVDGKPLSQVIAEQGALRPSSVRQVVDQLAAGLGAAHQNGFVHRDVKPSNVMIQGSLQDPNVKLLDFGTVGLQEQSKGDPRLTRMGHVIGTPTYMAPEQAQDPGVNHQADLYAIGVVMYEMLTGAPPFDSADRAALLAAHIAKPVPPIADFEGLGNLVQALMQKTPKERPSSAEAVRRMLNQPQRRLFQEAPDEVDPYAFGFNDWEMTAGLEPTFAPERKNSGDDTLPSGLPDPGQPTAVLEATVITLGTPSEALLYEPTIEPGPNHRPPRPTPTDSIRGGQGPRRLHSTPTDPIAGRQTVVTLGPEPTIDDAETDHEAVPQLPSLLADEAITTEVPHSLQSLVHEATASVRRSESAVRGRPQMSRLDRWLLPMTALLLLAAAMFLGFALWNRSAEPPPLELSPLAPEPTTRMQP